MGRSNGWTGLPALPVARSREDFNTNPVDLNVHPDISAFSQVEGLLHYVRSLDLSDDQRLRIFMEALSLGHVTVPVGTRIMPLSDTDREWMRERIDRAIGQGMARIEYEMRHRQRY